MKWLWKQHWYCMFFQQFLSLSRGRHGLAWTEAAEAEGCCAKDFCWYCSVRAAMCRHTSRLLVWGELPSAAIPLVFWFEVGCRVSSYPSSSGLRWVAMCWHTSRFLVWGWLPCVAVPLIFWFEVGCRVLLYPLVSGLRWVAVCCHSPHHLVRGGLPCVAIPHIFWFKVSCCLSPFPSSSGLRWVAMCRPTPRLLVWGGLPCVAIPICWFKVGCCVSINPLSFHLSWVTVCRITFQSLCILKLIEFFLMYLHPSLFDSKFFACLFAPLLNVKNFYMSGVPKDTYCYSLQNYFSNSEYINLLWESCRSKPFDSNSENHFALPLKFTEIFNLKGSYICQKWWEYIQLLPLNYEGVCLSLTVLPSPFLKDQICQVILYDCAKV